MKMIRRLIQEKKLKLKHVKAHVGIVGNEAADKEAKKCNESVTESPQQMPTNAFHVVFKGEKFIHPHKAWTKTEIPTHQQLDIWHVSCWPLRYKFQTWIKWIYACKCSAGYDSYHSVWAPPGTTGFIKHAKMCVKCGTMHNLSVHGCIAFCNESHPVVQAWAESWPLSIQTKIKQWRTNANQRDRFILGKLCLPVNMRKSFKDWKISWRDSRIMIRKFQNTVTDKMQTLLPLRDTYTQKRPNPWKK